MPAALPGKVTNLHQADTVRLIPSARLKPPALAALADTDDELEALARLESATHGRLQAQAEGLAGLDPRELVFGVPNHTFINAAFAYTRPGGNRFNDETRGAWYAAFEVETSLKEVAFHLTRALIEAGNAFDNTTQYAELLADFIGPFHDLRTARPRPACLDAEAATGYPAGQRLARDLRERGSPGIVYPSVRRRGGTCLAAFHPAVVQNVRQGGLWTLTWKGRAEPGVERG